MFLISSFVVIFFLMVNEILSNCLNMISIKLKISSWTYSVINTTEKGWGSIHSIGGENQPMKR